jgi:hypothetical protein
LSLDQRDSREIVEELGDAIEPGMIPSTPALAASRLCDVEDSASSNAPSLPCAMKAHGSGIALGRLRYYFSRMSVLTCKLPSSLDDRLADLAKRRGVPKSVLVREAIEAKIAEEAAIPRRPPANLIEALGDSVGSIASGKRDLARNKKHLKGYGR